MKKILIITATAGGGHNANARDFERILTLGDQEVEVEIFDVLDSLPKFKGKNLAEYLYTKAANQYRLAWRLYYRLHDDLLSFGMLVGWTRLEFKTFVRKAIHDKLEEYQPDVVLSTYSHIQSTLDLCLDKLGQHPRKIVVVTDPFTASKSNFLGKDSEYILYSYESAKLARNSGIKNQNIFLTQPPVDPKFKPKKSKGSYILVLGGGGGLPKMKRIFKNLRNNRDESVFVCGRDSKMKNYIENRIRQLNLKNITVHGFVNNIAELIADAKCVISKAGPATMFEILSSQKPLIIADYIEGQERGNLEFVNKNKYGIYEKHPRKLLALVERIDNNKILFNKYYHNFDYSHIVDYITK